MIELDDDALRAGVTIASPVDLRSKVLSPSTVWLEWKDPAQRGGRVDTDSRYYNVHYRPLMASDAAGRTLSVVVKTDHVVFYDLRPGTRYEFKVRAVKDAVASAFSETIVNKTFETGTVNHRRRKDSGIRERVAGGRATVVLVHR